MPYTSEKHIHNFAAWAASTAARTSPKCRFRVEVGSKILTRSSLPGLISDRTRISECEDFGVLHRELRDEIVRIAKSNSLSFTHGVAAKMINIYLKAIYLSTDLLVDPDMAKIHPPIDRVLLEGLAEATSDKDEKKKWRKHSTKGWSNYNSEYYERVIGDVAKKCGDKPLWTIEEHWKGHQ